MVTNLDPETYDYEDEEEEARRSRSGQWLVLSLWVLAVPTLIALLWLILH